MIVIVCQPTNTATHSFPIVFQQKIRYHHIKPTKETANFKNITIKRAFTPKEKRELKQKFKKLTMPPEGEENDNNELCKSIKGGTYA